MKGATKNLKQLLNSGIFLTADLYAFTLTDGKTLHLTSYDVPLSYGNETYRPALLTRTMLTQRAGLMVDQMTVTAHFDATDKWNEMTLLQAFVAGTFDNAFLTVYRAFMPTDRPTDTSAGAVFLFSGRVDVECAGRSTAELSVKSISELCNTNLPRNLWMPTCRHTIYDASCALEKEKHLFYGAVLSDSTAAVLVSNIEKPDGYFDFGILHMLSGKNENVRMSVQRYEQGRFYLTRPLPYPPSATDNFSVYAGCDKMLDTCREKFQNTAHFRGFPFIPRPESLM